MGDRGPTPLVKGRWPKARGDREGEYERGALILSRPPAILKVNCPEGAREGGLGHWFLSHRWERNSPPAGGEISPPKQQISAGAAGASPRPTKVRNGEKDSEIPHNRNEENHMSKKEEKTNVMRVLDQKKIPYTPHTYPHGDGEAPDGVTVAQNLGIDPDQVFKTLVTKGASGGYYVFDIPVAATLDLKKAAKAVGEKSVAMLPSKELLPLTGYVHGGCSPIGMKKQFPTVFHQSALEQETIFVSAGKIGFQVELSPADLMKLVRGTAADVTAATE